MALLLAALAPVGGAQEPPAAGSPKLEQAGPPPPPEASDAQLKVDLATATAEVVGRMLSTPHFQEHVEVRDRYQDALDAYLRSADIGCGPRGGPEPTPYDDMNRVAGTSIPPHADLLAGARWLFHRAKKDSAASNGRYYVYSVSMTSSPGRIVHVVRDGPIPENGRSRVPGTSWQLVGPVRGPEQGSGSDRPPAARGVRSARNRVSGAVDGKPLPSLNGRRTRNLNRRRLEESDEVTIEPGIAIPILLACRRS